MKLSIRGLALACGSLWGGALLTVSLARQVNDEYASDFVRVIKSVYTGFGFRRGAKDAVLAALYGFLDGACAGLLLGWLYNLIAGREARSKS